MDHFRNAITAVFYSEDAKVLACRHSDNGSLQLPQGGIEPGETSEQALYREVLEELGIESFSVIKRALETNTYVWPEPNSKGQIGQRIHWFLCQINPRHLPNLSISDESFSEVTWIAPEKLLSHFPDWKAPATEQGFRLLGIL